MGIIAIKIISIDVEAATMYLLSKVAIEIREHILDKYNVRIEVRYNPETKIIENTYNLGEQFNTALLEYKSSAIAPL